MPKGYKPVESAAAAASASVCGVSVAVVSWAAIEPVPAPARVTPSRAASVSEPIAPRMRWFIVPLFVLRGRRVGQRLVHAAAVSYRAHDVLISELPDAKPQSAAPDVLHGGSNGYGVAPS